MLKSATIDERKRELTLVLELQEPTPSATGKTLVVATTRGNTPTSAMLNGKPVIVGVNAYLNR